MKIPSIFLAGKEVLPIIEGGKGISVSTGLTAGRFAAAGAVGTFSGVNPDAYDKDGNIVKRIFKGKTRSERQKEMIQYAIDGGVAQARIAHEESKGNGRIFMNILWEMGGAVDVLEGVLSRAKGLIHGISCGAGMPYGLGEIAEKFKVYYNPIVSSARAFKILWKRAYRKHKRWLGAVIFEDPWLAGGHNGLSNAEDPKQPQDPYHRIREIREFMNEVGLKSIPIIIAGGVWCLSEWANYVNNPEIGPVAFQLGTRPLVTQESPISDAFKQKLLTLDKGDITLQRFSPTGFYSSAVRNDFLKKLEARSARQVSFTETEMDGFVHRFKLQTGTEVFLNETNLAQAKTYIEQGYTVPLKTPDHTLVFVGTEEAQKMQAGMRDCIGCLSACLFSGWSQRPELKLGADPRSFCIQNTLFDISHGGDVEKNLMFAGHLAWRFKQDPLYANGHIPTIKELIDTAMTGA